LRFPERECSPLRARTNVGVLIRWAILPFDE